MSASARTLSDANAAKTIYYGRPAQGKGYVTDLPAEFILRQDFLPTIVHPSRVQGT
jgi:hypothetical protein